MNGHIRNLDFSGDLALSHASDDTFQNGAIHVIPSGFEAFQIGADDGGGLGVLAGIGGACFGVAFDLAVIVHDFQISGGGVFAVLVEDGRDTCAGGVVDDGDQGDRALALRGAAFVRCGQLVRIKGSSHTQPRFRNKFVKVMQPVQAEGGNLGELQVMVFGAVADGVLGGLMNAALQHGDLLGLVHLAPFGDALGSVAGGVLAFCFSPCDLQAFAHQDFRNAAAHIGGSLAANVPGAAHNSGAVVCFAGVGGGGGGGHGGNPFQ